MVNWLYLNKAFFVIETRMKTSLTIPDSERLRYRLMTADDAPLWFELDQDPEVMRYLNNGMPSSWEEIITYFVPRVEKFSNPVTGCGLWEVVGRQSNDYLGWILVRQYGIDTSYHEPDNIELGWRLKKYCWGQGIATEAASVIMQILQQNPLVKKFSAIADAQNLGSIAVMKKLGMQYVDERIHHTPKQEMPVVYYEMPAR